MSRDGVQAIGDWCLAMRKFRRACHRLAGAISDEMPGRHSINCFRFVLAQSLLQRQHLRLQKRDPIFLQIVLPGSVGYMKCRWTPQKLFLDSKI